jgi:predicted transcriptional regulator
VIRYVLPAFRATVARSLIVDYGYTQSEAARLLGTTQAAISYYMGERRGKRIRSFENNDLVRAAATDVAKGLSSGDLSGQGATAKFCQLCAKLRSSEVLCQFHRDIEKVDELCNLCVMNGC